MIPRLHGESALNEMWRHTQEQDESTDQALDATVKAALIEAFSGDAYEYEMYVDTAKVFQTYISVLGRVVKPEESISDAEADRLILPAAA